MFEGGRAVSQALYFSRARVPSGDGPLWHHIGIYAFRRPALARFVALPQSPLERRESLEQLRALEAGMRIACTRVEHGPFGGRHAGGSRPGPPTHGHPIAGRGAPPMTVSFQGRPGAYSDLACRAALPGRPTLPCDTFEAAIEAVRTGAAELAMLPCENSLAGRVPDIHSLLPGSGLHIVGEHFQRVEHCLLGVPGARVADVRRVHSHAVALGQVRRLVHELGVQAVVEADTAGSAQMIAERGEVADAAIASALAAEMYGLDILRMNVEDRPDNTTRFYITARQAAAKPPDTGITVTTFVFHVRNVPAALYKCLGGFATNGVNMTKLESYMLAGEFTATQFLCDVEGHPDHPNVSRALEELEFFSREMRVLGVYPGAARRSAEKLPQSAGHQ